MVSDGQQLQDREEETDSCDDKEGRMMLEVCSGFAEAHKNINCYSINICAQCSTFGDVRSLGQINTMKKVQGFQLYWQR